MSVVTGIVLHTSCAEGALLPDHDVPNELLQIAQWLRNRDRACLVEVQDLMCTGKHPQTYVLGGGYNYFPEEEFAAFVMSLPWRCPENVVLIVNPEDGPARVYRPKF